MTTDFFSARWPELSFLLLMIIGFFVALFTKIAIINYLTILIAGVIIGKLLLTKRLSRSFFFYFVIAGFIFGFLFGSFNANRIVSFLFLVAGIVIGAYVIKDRF